MISERIGAAVAQNPDLVISDLDGSDAEGTVGFALDSAGPLRTAGL